MFNWPLSIKLKLLSKNSFLMIGFLVFCSPFPYFCLAPPLLEILFAVTSDIFSCSSIALARQSIGRRDPDMISCLSLI